MFVHADLGPVYTTRKRRRHRAVQEKGSMGSYGSIYTSDGAVAIAIDGTIAIRHHGLMGFVPIAPRPRWTP